MSRVVLSSSSGVSGWCAHAQRLTLLKIRFSHFAKFLLLPAMLSFLLSACAIEGDFGRFQPTILQQMTDRLLPSETTLLGSRGGSGVTNDEMAMREAGHRLASPLMPSPPSDAGARGGYGVNYYRPSNPLAVIDESLQIDHQALTQFGLAARRVMFTDSRRMRAVYDNDPMILVEDKQTALVRKKENFAFVEQTFQDFGRRLQAYYYALDESKISQPYLVTVEMDGSLSHLRDRTASLQYELTTYFGTAVARRGDYHPPRFASSEYNAPNNGPRQQPYPAVPPHRSGPNGMPPNTSFK